MGRPKGPAPLLLWRGTSVPHVIFVFVNVFVVAFCRELVGMAGFERAIPCLRWAPRWRRLVSFVRRRSLLSRLALAISVRFSLMATVEQILAARLKRVRVLLDEIKEQPGSEHEDLLREELALQCASARETFAVLAATRRETLWKQIDRHSNVVVEFPSLIRGLVSSGAAGRN